MELPCTEQLNHSDWKFGTQFHAMVIESWPLPVHKVFRVGCSASRGPWTTEKHCGVNKIIEGTGESSTFLWGSQRGVVHAIACSHLSCFFFFFAMLSPSFTSLCLSYAILSDICVIMSSVIMACSVPLLVSSFLCFFALD